VGLVHQLGHDGAPCPVPGPIQKDFTVFDTNGVHSVHVRFCECHGSAGASHHRTQLLRARWLPASIQRPRTAFTFDVLESFHLLTLQGKTSLYDFYWFLVYKSDNSGTLGINVRLHTLRMLCNINLLYQDRYEQFLTAVHIWRHMKLVERAGRGHDPKGVAATSPGQCAVECPACPHPDRNLPKDWEKAAPGVL
jgi:CxC2 like cysteine cluster associated with KDZ transposases